MRSACSLSACLVLTSLAALQCGTPPEERSLIQLRTEQLIAGSFAADGHVIEFSATQTAPLAGEVQVRSGALRYDVHYDYEQRTVVADGHGGALELAAQHPLLQAIDLLSSYLGRANPELPLQERMLYAGLSMLRDSGGMPLEAQVFDLEPSGTEIEKALGDDGVGCIESGQTYHVSFDFGGSTVLDAELQAGSTECNGQCGPYCTQLTPWRMWTLDCLEHDSCCNVTSDDSCWTPLGECGDEYDDAMADFLRGFDPFRRHCRG